MLHHADTDILFPPRVIPQLRDLRGPLWRDLIDRVSQHQSERHLDVLAFTLLMIRHCGCLSCHPHNYRAMRGCRTCAMHVVARIKVNDLQLVREFDAICEELRETLPQTVGISSVQNL